MEPPIQRLVHYVAWAQQPDIQILCDSVWTTPGWKQPDDNPEDIYLTDESPSRYYTFEKEKVTCEACLNLI